MGKTSTEKGRRGEQELAGLLRDCGYEIMRGGVQSYGTIPDLVGLPGVHIEVKRTEKTHIDEWMMQAIADSVRFKDGMPAVFHRRSRKPWLVTMRLGDWLRMYQALSGIDAVAVNNAGEYKNTSEA